MKGEFSTIPDCQALEWISQPDIAHLIQDTDLAITRGSATTLAELTVFGKKSKLIIIPLPYSANNHQYYNALEYKGMGHIVLEQKSNTMSDKKIEETSIPNGVLFLDMLSRLKEVRKHNF
jgi:UDP-N-acetylglucosamine:LPS N-acetylglucosamine transferase